MHRTNPFFALPAATAALGSTAALLVTPQSVRAQNLFVVGTAGQFGTLNVTAPSSTNYTRLGTTTYNGTVITLGGLANAANGNLYGLELAYVNAAPTARLFQVSRTNGALSLVGAVSAFSTSSGNAYTGLGNTSDGTLYAYYTPNLFTTNNALYTLNASSAVATKVGAGDMGVKLDGGINGDGSGNLFAFGGDTNKADYFIYRTTGDAPRLNNTTTAGTVYALGFTNSNLYALNSSGGIYSVNTSNGTTTNTGQTFNTALTGSISGAANVTPFDTPEPGTLPLAFTGLVTGAGVLSAARHRRKAKDQSRTQRLT